jgi:hypothetical protein
MNRCVHQIAPTQPLQVTKGLPQRKSGSASRSIPLETTSCGGIFEVANISLCSGLQVCSPPRSSLVRCEYSLQGSRGFYVRAERGSLPPRVSDMLTAQRQANWRYGDLHPASCGLVGCSFPRPSLSFRRARLARHCQRQRST